MFAALDQRQASRRQRFDARRRRGFAAEEVRLTGNQNAMVWRVISSIMAVCARRNSAVATPRAAPAPLLAALSQKLIQGFFMSGERDRQAVVPR